MDGAVKDAGLIIAAMRESGTDAMLMEAVGSQYRKASDAGHGSEDMAAVFRAFRPKTPRALSMPGRGDRDGPHVLPGPAGRGDGRYRMSLTVKPLTLERWPALEGCRPGGRLERLLVHELADRSPLP